MIFAFLLLKQGHAQTEKKLAPEFKSISITPAAYMLETSDKVTYSVLEHSLTLNFGLNKDFAFWPYLSVSGAIGTIWFPKEKPIFTKRIKTNLGVGKSLGPVDISADGGIGMCDGQFLHQFNLMVGGKICNISKKSDLSCLAGIYYEKFIKSPFAIGGVVVICITLSK